MSSIRVDVTFSQQPRSLKLAGLLGDDLAIAWIIQLWCWAKDNAPDGRITGRDPGRLVEAATRWTGAPGALVDAALTVGFLERDGDALVLCGWEQPLLGGLCTPEQARDLGRYGIDADGLTFSDASEILAAIKRNGWKAPSSSHTPPGGH